MTPNQSAPMNLETLTRAVRTLAGKIQKVEQELPATREGNLSGLSLADRLRQQCDREIPFIYCINVDIVGGTTTRVERSVLIEQQGAFLLQRIHCCWRPTAGANAGKWRPCSSGNPTIAGSAAVAGAAVADVLDFQFEWVDGVSKRGRQNQAVPGDILYRQDMDGLLQCSDVFIAASTVTFAVAPTVGPDNTGVLTVVMEGIQLLSARP